MLRNLVDRLRTHLLSKQDAEAYFWRKEISRIQDWFNGTISLYNTPPPTPAQKVKASNPKDASILTWHRVHQEVKYLKDLELPPYAFQGMSLLDVGSGPMPSATCFCSAKLYCLEPLLPNYMEVGFPLHVYSSVHFVNGMSEAIPVPNAFFDAVISVNAIDHVDDIRQTALEIKRVMKPRALLRMHVHYHSPTRCEPIELNDAFFRELFGWVGNLRKLKASKKNHSTTLGKDESFALWSNF